MATRNKLKKVHGFVLHFGYVESSRIGTIFLTHTRGGFNSLPAALKNLADYLMEDYLVSWMHYECESVDGPLRPSRMSQAAGTPSIDQFQHYLDQIPFSVASAGIGEASFDSSHVNAEDWWPWDQLYELYPYLGSFYENIETPVSAILCHYVTPEKIPDGELRNEIVEFQNEELSEWMTNLRDHKKTFRSVVMPKKKKRR